MGGGLGRALKEKVETAGYKICNGCKQNYDGASVRVLTKKINIKSVLEEQRPTMVVIAAGGNGSTGAGNFIDKIKTWHPEGDKVKIYWFGPPPSVVSKTGSRKFVDGKFRGFESRKKLNGQIAGDVSGKPNVTFINPYEHVTDFYKKGGDGLHMPYGPAKKFVDMAFGVSAAAVATAAGKDVKIREVEGRSHRHGRIPKGKLPEIIKAIKDAGQRHGVDEGILMGAVQLESGFNPYARSYANARGLFQFMPKTGRAYGLKTEEDFYGIEKNADAGARLFIKNIRAAEKVTGASLTPETEYLAYIAHNQGRGGLNQIFRAANGGRQPSKIVLRNMRGQGNAKHAMAKNPNNPAQGFLDFFKRKWTRVKPKGIAIANSAQAIAIA